MDVGFVVSMTIIVSMTTVAVITEAYRKGYHDGAENTDRLGLTEVKRQFHASPWYRVTTPKSLNPAPLHLSDTAETRAANDTK